MSVEEFRGYLVAGEDEDPMIKLCYDAAVQSAKDAGIPDYLFTADDKKLTLYVYALAAHYYDNRGFMAVGAQDDYTKRMMTKMCFELKHRTEGADG